jgi:hypothetical protein
MTESIRPFRIAVDEAVLDDLRQRLRRTRWPEAELVDDWSQGAPRAWIQDICQHWAERYDWRARERLLNRHAQFITTHRRPGHPLPARALAARAGLALAADPRLAGLGGRVPEGHRPADRPHRAWRHAADAFHVVCPSLPGFGFSGKPAATGWGVDRIAAAWAQLMARLGYTRYFAQGGDWGSAVTRSLGAQDAAHCAGIHVTLAMGSRPCPPPRPAPKNPGAGSASSSTADWDSGYSKQQATRPQTLGYA